MKQKQNIVQKHKLEGMFDVKSKRCSFKDCNKGPSFNFQNETKTKYCAKHKLEWMFNVKSKKCSLKNYKNFENMTYFWYFFERHLSDPPWRSPDMYLVFPTSLWCILIWHIFVT